MLSNLFLATQITLSPAYKLGCIIVADDNWTFKPTVVFSRF